MEVGVEANGLNKQSLDSTPTTGINNSIMEVDIGGVNGNGCVVSGESALIHVEVRLRNARYLSSHGTAEKSDHFKNYLSGVQNIFNWKAFDVEDDALALVADRMVVSCSRQPDGNRLTLADEDLKLGRVHIYVVKDFGPMAQDLSINGNGTDEPSGLAIGSHHYEMPCKEFEDLWEALIYDDDIKSELLSYAYALLRLSDKGANTNILSINRLILLHGPPGTGKTSLCKALAQRLSIRLSTRYKRCIFVEVNSHSLFSKWFSESGKLIGKLFEEIEELASHPNWLVFVLIDEVESLTMGRNAAFSGADPSDSVRAVNAVLTQLDKIKRFPNVLVLATSNISTALDTAFVDRTDVCRMVGNPSSKAALAILASAIAEFQRICVVADTPKLCSSLFNKEDAVDQTEEVHFLERLAGKCIGMSGRSIRKLPVLAYSKCMVDRPSLIQLLFALEAAVQEFSHSTSAKKHVTLQSATD